MSRKMLCLHGFAHNGPIFARKCAALVQALQKVGIEAIFATAPVSVTGVDHKYGVKDVLDMRTWWSIDKTSAEYLVMDNAIESLRQVVKTHGPFVGVLGFSQGAGFAGAICTHMPQFFPGHPPLKFAIFVGGFILSANFYQHLYSNKFTIPTCHVLGQYDTIVSEERSMALFNNCDPSTRVLIRHPGSHFVPSQERYVDEIVSFVKHSIEAEAGSQKVE